MILYGSIPNQYTTGVCFYLHITKTFSASTLTPLRDAESLYLALITSVLAMILGGTLFDGVASFSRGEGELRRFGLRREVKKWHRGCDLSGRAIF
jgi:hypothetical protein